MTKNVHVTFDEAMSELGVPRGSTPATVRRAYLRLCKTRTPDIDPEGFDRLRQAYEICRALASHVETPPSSVSPLSSGMFGALAHIERPDVPAPEITPPPPDSLHALTPGMPSRFAQTLRGAPEPEAPPVSDFRWFYVPIAATVLWVVFQLLTN
ncbi:J domain-containing protein [Pendulispora albinea]|uniref:J domain-containing protein n=1 Tax=Pendulispora albinea TaxID=2741071 RepID=A0ABZ2LYD9_9BACT